MADKTKGQTLRDELFYVKKNAFEIKTPEELAAAKEYAAGYTAWLDQRSHWSPSFTRVTKAVSKSAVPA